ncbi:hypothetical protein KGV31_002175 [Vibrio parahaemolyticus]|nr:hypothetical protein [Vibrio parahaemolyticus]EHU0344318.1 hypothetical protein [Vibrio parahaemolyticus]EHU0354352.1 hypothetical protein [Vibrio parahaemolyticus]
MGDPLTVLMVMSAAMSVVSMAITLSMDNSAKDSGASIDRKGQDNPKVVAFGNCRVPAARVWNNVHNHTTEALCQAYSFGVGPIRAIDEVYIDSVRYFNGHIPSANKWYGSESSSAFPNVQMGLRLGQLKEQTAYPALIDYSDGEWTVECRGDRTPSASLLVWREINKDGDNNVRFISDRVKLEALVKGNAVIDPRFDISLSGAADVTKRTWINGELNHEVESYRNPACVMLTYLVDNYYGLGVPTDAVDIHSFIELANYCDEQGFTFDGYIDQSGDYAQILVDMCSSFDGMVYVEDGLINVKADSAAPVVAHIDVDHIVDGFKLSNVNDSSYYNLVNCDFVNIDTDYAKDKFVLPKDINKDETIRRDGFKKDKTFKFPYTACNSETGEFELIKKLANRKLKRAKFQQTIEMGIDNTLVSVKLHDVISITNPDYGLENALFRVTKIQTSLDDKTMISKVSATQYDDSVYDDSSYEDGTTSTPKPEDDGIILSPANLTFEQTSFTTSGQGLLTWVSRYMPEHKTVVEYKLHSANEWKRVNEVILDKYEFSGLRPDYYDFRVMTRNYFGSTSEWTVLENQHIQGGVTVPNITNLNGTFESEDAIIKWDCVKDIKLDIPDNAVFDGISTVGDVFSHYEIVVNKGSNSGYAETLTSTVNELTYTYERNAQTHVNRNVEFVVYAVAKDGSRSLAGTKLRLVNQQTTAPTGLSVESVLSNVSIKWEHPTDRDFFATDVHISNDAEFVPSNNNLVISTDLHVYTLTKEYTGIHYIKVGHYDKFGKDGMVYSPALSFTQKTIDDLLDEAPSFVEAEIELAGVKDEVTSIQTEVDGIQSDLVQVDKDIAAVDDRVDEAVRDIIENATSIVEVNETLGNQQAQITSNKKLIEGTQGNLASLESSVESQFEDANAAINSNSTAISGVDEALSSHKTSVAAEFAGVKSSIQTNQTAIANANESITALDNKLSSEIDGVSSNITQNYYTKTQTDGKVSSAVNALKTELSSSIDGVQDEVDAVESNLSQNYYTKTQTTGEITEAVSALETELSSSIDGVQDEVDAVESNLSQNYYTKTATDGKVTSAISALETKLNSSIEGVQDEVDAVESNLSQNYYTKANTDGKINTAVSALETELSSSIAGVDGKVNSTNANLSNNYYTKTQTDGKVSSAIASSESKLTAEVGSKYATISNLNTVKVTADGAASATSQLTQTVNGKTGGIIMNNDGSTTKTTVVADRFYIAQDAGGKAPTTVFQVSGGKTIIKDALIGNLSAGKITTGTMSGDRISATSKIFVGSGTSSATLSGSDATWRIAAGHSTMGSAPFRVDKAGKMYATNADIQGIIRAKQLIFVDNNIPAEIKNSNVTVSSIGAETPSGAQAKANAAKTSAISTAASDATSKADAAKSAAISSAKSYTDSGLSGKVNTSAHYPHQNTIQIKSSSYVAGKTGWAIDQSGTAEFNNVTVRGVVHATTGTFKGDITGSSGTFEGTVKADRVIGDLVSAKAYSAVQTQFTNKGTWNTIATLRVTNNLGTRATFLVSPIGIASSCSKGAASPTHSVTASTTCTIRILRGSTQVFSQSFSDSSTTTGGNAYANAYGAMAAFTETINAGVTNTYVVQINHTRADIDNPKVYVCQPSVTAQLFRDGGSFSRISDDELLQIEEAILLEDERRAAVPEMMI